MKAPVELVTPPHTPVPFSPVLEKEWIPSVERIEQAVRKHWRLRMSEIKTLEIPKWGLSMEEGTIAQWLIKEGDSFNKGDEICEVKPQKSSMC